MQVFDTYEALAEALHNGSIEDGDIPVWRNEQHQYAIAEDTEFDEDERERWYLQGYTDNMAMEAYHLLAATHEQKTGERGLPHSITLPGYIVRLNTDEVARMIMRYGMSDIACHVPGTPFPTLGLAISAAREWGEQEAINQLHGSRKKRTLHGAVRVERATITTDDEYWGEVVRTYKIEELA